MYLLPTYIYFKIALFLILSSIGIEWSRKVAMGWAFHDSRHFLFSVFLKKTKDIINSCFKRLQKKDVMNFVFFLFWMLKKFYVSGCCIIHCEMLSVRLRVDSTILKK